MDAFMDKLAQKLTAQEMIKANAAADAAEMNRLKKQVSQYEDLLGEMREAAEQVSKLTVNCVAKLENTDKVTLLVEESMAKIREIQQDGQAVQAMEEKMAELQGAVTALQAELSDYVHKENVKVYRNVQAVVIEELSKQNETIRDTMKESAVKINAIFGISLVALLAAAAGVTLQILSFMW